MGLSSNILWHQTGEEGFYAILKSKRLRYSYCLERIIPVRIRGTGTFIHLLYTNKHILFPHESLSKCSLN